MTLLLEPTPPAAKTGRVRTVDAEGGLDVWARPGVSAELVGSVPDGVPVAVAAVRKHWARLSAPVEGWVPRALLLKR